MHATEIKALCFVSKHKIIQCWWFFSWYGKLYLLDKSMEVLENHRTPFFDSRSICIGIMQCIQKIENPTVREHSYAF